jgi:hypothetical protein
MKAIVDMLDQGTYKVTVSAALVKADKEQKVDKVSLLAL